MKTKYLTLSLLATFPILCGCNKTDAMKDYINNINKAISSERSSIQTCYDAVIAARNNGVDVENQNPRSGLTLAFDVSSKQFVLFSGDTIKYAPDGYNASSNSMNYFRFVDTYNPNVTYSQYLKSDATSPGQLLITTGFDCGEHKNIEKVAYTNLAENGKDVIIRTDCDYFSVLAPRDTVRHYNFASNVLLTTVKNFEIDGYISYTKATEGNVIFKANSTCEIFEKTSDDLGETKVVTHSAEEGSTIYRTVNYEPIGTATKLELNPIKTEEEFRKAASDKKAQFIRLDSDIDIEYDNVEDLIKFSKGACIDLNGNKLKFKNGIKGTSTKQEAFRIQPDSSDLFFYIVDSKGVTDDNSGIELNDCSILVTSMIDKDTSYKTTFVANSGKITQVINSGSSVTVDELAAAVVLLGQTGEGSPKPVIGYFYGGSIETKNNRSDYKKSGCIGIGGKGSQVDVSYGKLTSTDYCIIGDKDEVYKIYDLGGTVVTVNGGTFTSTSKPCIYFPLSNELTINGGTLNGPSCINMIEGNIAINNATLNATAKYVDPTTNNYDGSVILSPKGELTSEDNLNIGVTNSTLYSHYAYIAAIYGDTTKANTTTINYNSGYFDYHLGNGNYKESSTVTIKEGGTWNKHYA